MVDKLNDHPDALDLARSLYEAQEFYRATRESDNSVSWLHLEPAVRGDMVDAMSALLKVGMLTRTNPCLPTHPPYHERKTMKLVEVQVDLTDEEWAFADGLIAEGLFEDRSAVMREALTYFFSDEGKAARGIKSA